MTLLRTQKQKSKEKAAIGWLPTMYQEKIQDSPVTSTKFMSWTKNLNIVKIDKDTKENIASKILEQIWQKQAK